MKLYEAKCCATCLERTLNTDNDSSCYVYCGRFRKSVSMISICEGFREDSDFYYIGGDKYLEDMYLGK